MRPGIALQRYLERHIEPGLPELPTGAGPWRHVLVIPAYHESAVLLDKLASTLTSREHSLLILVLNRPDTEQNVPGNAPLRAACNRLPMIGPALFKLNQYTDLYLHDLETLRGPTPASRGVGLARKVGCDLALYWHSCGHIASDWICSSDADAVLPRDYFQRLAQVPGGSVAATYPFAHVAGKNALVNDATALYELWLHHYVLGLAYAASPYAYHSLGSCIAIRGDCYAQVRGFPRRSGGEDFYLLNKAAKTGTIARLEGQCIELQSRASERVPFGTGPAVNKIMAGGAFAQQHLFYHPHIFEALRIWLLAIPLLSTVPLAKLKQALIDLSLSPPLALASHNALVNLGLENALIHCRRQGKSAAQFSRQFHQWFDGFRTLKFIHALRDVAWPDQGLADLPGLTPTLWPGISTERADITSLRSDIRDHWRWTAGLPVQSGNSSRN